MNLRSVSRIFIFLMLTFPWASVSLFSMSLKETAPLLKEGNYEKVVRIYQKTYGQTPLDPAVNYNLSLAYYLKSSGEVLEQKQEDLVRSVEHFYYALSSETLDVSEQYKRLGSATQNMPPLSSLYTQTVASPFLPKAYNTLVFYVSLLLVLVFLILRRPLTKKNPAPLVVATTLLVLITGFTFFSELNRKFLDVAVMTQANPVVYDSDVSNEKLEGYNLNGGDSFVLTNEGKERVAFFAGQRILWVSKKDVIIISLENWEKKYGLAL